MAVKLIPLKLGVAIEPSSTVQAWGFIKEIPAPIRSEASFTQNCNKAEKK